MILTMLVESATYNSDRKSMNSRCELTLMGRLICIFFLFQLLSIKPPFEPLFPTHLNDMKMISRWILGADRDGVYTRDEAKYLGLGYLLNSYLATPHLGDVLNWNIII